MKMKKLHFIFLLITASLFFILIQLYFTLHVPNIINKKRHSDSVTAVGSVSYKNIRSFLGLCREDQISVILIDPDILQSILSNATHTDPGCIYLCSDRRLTTFAVLAGSLQDEKFQNRLKKERFRFIRSRHKDPRLLGIENLVNDDITTHYFIERGGHVIHVVILYERTGLYWWHGPVRFKSRTAERAWREMKIDTAAVRFGKHPGAYNLQEVVSITLDGVRLHTFRFPWRFLQEIPHARFIECDHMRAALFHSQYRQERTAEAVSFKLKAKAQLMRTKKVLDNLGVRFWMSSGTCLGWFRQCDIIPYSKDVDVGIWIKDYNPRLISEFQLAGFKLKHLFGKVSDSFELSFQNEDDVKVDIFFFYEEKDYMWNGGTQAKTGKKFKYIFPKFHLCWTEFLEMKIRIPCETESYVEANYGKNWFSPVKVWDWKQSPPNVRENGVWPAEEQEQVIQMYRVDR